METLQPTCPRYRIWLQALAAGAPLASIGERVLAMEDPQSPLYFYFEGKAITAQHAENQEAWHASHQ